MRSNVAFALVGAAVVSWIAALTFFVRGWTKRPPGVNILALGRWSSHPRLAPMKQEYMKAFLAAGVSMLCILAAALVGR